MRPTDVIMKKRLGGSLDRAEIDAFVRGAVDGSFADYQLAALLMAICIRGMDDRETVDLTMSMAHSGELLDLSAIEGVKADKHSTGGVGDTTTLIVAPLVAACGVKVAKMSGRGLGFTGGTLDKLESIPGFSVNLPMERFLETVRSVGLSVIGQTKDLAPADKALYALRDVTATVDCLPLIVSSILSKKIAAGCDAVVLDVKVGSGAMMPTVEQAIRLAETMVRISRLTGRRYSALVTDMNQPLGLAVGNALEVEEAIRTLAGEVEGPLLEVSLELGAQMLLNAGRVAGRESAIALLRQALTSGAGLQKLADMIRAQGGDERVARDPDRLPRAKRLVEVTVESAGYVADMRTSDIGYAALAMGAGRAKKSDEPDPAVGLVMCKRVGDPVDAGEPLCVLHATDRSDVAAAANLVRGAIRLSQQPVSPPPLIHARVE